MNALELNIESRNKEKIGYLANLKDFSYSSANKIDPNVVLKNPQVSLYCFDDTAKNAVFVELPQDIDLTKVPFVYQAQYDYAKRLIVVPYELFSKLADCLPEVRRPIFIYMAGRSGSTLLSHVFNASNVVVSLSEPDVATQLAHLRFEADENRISEIRNLAQCAMRFLFKPYHTDGIHAHALKFRSEGIRVADLMQNVFPDAKNLFLYRDAMSWVLSFYKLIKSNHDMPEYLSVNDWIKRNEDNKRADFSHLTAYLPSRSINVSIPEQLALWKIAIIEWYLEQIELGTPILAVRYQDLNQYREKVLKSIFTYCGIPKSRLSLGIRAFDRDSQADSHLIRKKEKEINGLKLNVEQTLSVSSILNRHPVLSNTNFMVPGTLQI